MRTVFKYIVTQDERSELLYRSVGMFDVLSIARSESVGNSGAGEVASKSISFTTTQKLSRGDYVGIDGDIYEVKVISADALNIISVNAQYVTNEQPKEGQQ